MANIANIGAGKPKISGAISCVLRSAIDASSGAVTLPTAAASDTPTGFTSLGYISDAGLSNSNSPETDETKSWGGSVVMTTQTSKEDKFTFTLIEATNKDVLSLVYGASNVTESSGAITVKATSDEPEHYAFCIIMSVNGKNKTIVVPNAKISDIAEVTYNDNDPVGYELTITAFPDPAVTTQDVTHYEYIGA